MDENQLFQAAKLLFLQNHGRKKVIEFLNENGITGEKAETMTTQAYLEIRNEIPERVVEETGDSGGFPSWLIYIGILVLINVLSAAFGWGFWIY